MPLSREAQILLEFLEQHPTALTEALTAEPRYLQLLEPLEALEVAGPWEPLPENNRGGQARWHPVSRLLLAEVDWYEGSWHPHLYGAAAEPDAAFADCPTLESGQRAVDLALRGRRWRLL